MAGTISDNPVGLDRVCGLQGRVRVVPLKLFAGEAVEMLNQGEPCAASHDDAGDKLPEARND